MTMISFEQDHIQEQLYKRYGKDLHVLFPVTNEDGDKLYVECYRIYNILDGDPTEWVLEELINSDTGISAWVWRRKS